MIILRDNQVDFVDKCIEVITDKRGRKAVAVACTAYGKSICIATIVERIKNNGKTLVLQPNIEILKQNVNKIKMLNVPVSIYSSSAGEKDLTEDVIYATPKSLNYEILKNLDIKHVIVDEADFSSKPNSEMIKLLKKLNIKSVLGLTGSPLYLYQNLEGSVTEIMTKVKGAFFNEICYVVQIQSMGKYWSDIKYFDAFDHSKQGILQLTGNKSDYTEESQKSFYEACNLREKVSAFLKRLPEGEDALVFVPSIFEAEELQKVLPHSAVVHSKMNKKIREDNISKFDKGEISILINIGSLLAGYDKPSLKNLVDCSASNSLRVKIQKDGRICRISEGKEFGRIIDFVGNYRRLGDVRELRYENIDGYGWGLFGKNDRLLTGVVLDSNQIINKQFLQNGGKISLGYTFGEHNDGSAKISFGKFKGYSLKYLYYKKRFYLKYLIENNYKFKEEDKEFERQLKEIYGKV